MQLSIQEAAAYLGMSPRTVRHLAKTGRLTARRVGNRWVIEKEALASISPGEQEARRERVAQIRERVNAALDEVAPAADPGQKRAYYSVRDMRSHAIGIEALAQVERLRAAHPAREDGWKPIAESLRSFLRALADGCHQFHPETKLERFVRARSLACAALSDVLLLQNADPALALGELVDRIERDLLGSLRGLLRRAEKRRR